MAMADDDTEPCAKDPFVFSVRKGSTFLPPEAGGHEELLDDDTSIDESTSPQTVESEQEEPAEAVSSGGGAHDGDDNYLPSNALTVAILPDSVKDSKHCLPDGTLKLRRPIPQVRVTELLKGLKMIDNHWIFEAEINGWPAMTKCMLTELYVLSSMANRIKYIKAIPSKLKEKRRKTLWTDGKDAADSLPWSKDFTKLTFATFLMPKFCAHGWLADSPGFSFWYSDVHCKPRVMCGERIVDMVRKDPDELSNARVTMVHAYAHRYAVVNETLRDKQTWHAGILVEWSHGQFTTMLEYAWRNGCGGYSGRSNFCEDKCEPVPNLFKVMPAGMILPWNNKVAEIRMIDMACKNKAEFEEFMRKYSNKNNSLPTEQRRFVDPVVYDSCKCRLRNCRPDDLAGYMLNYIRRAGAYDMLRSNCQTFTTDCYSFLGGVRNATPYANVVKPTYHQRHMSFLYAASYD